MRKYILTVIFMFLTAGAAIAQSSMTDQQVIAFVMEEKEKGTSEAQIAAQLMKQGVTVDQLRKVKQKYERQMKQDGLGTKNITTDDKSSDRLRKNNAEVPGQGSVSQYRQSDGNKTRTYTYDKQDPGFLELESELATFMNDTVIAEKRKVFGRDIFNNENLTFEPNMNIATPSDYRLGAGDAVFVDVWGASNSNFESTVTPDGTIHIEGFGPVSVAGLTVEQANSKLRRELGARYQDSKIRLTVGQTKTIMVNVMGEVKAPGTYTLSAFASVFHALYMAGGISEIGTLRDIKVYRKNKLITTVDVYDYILNGKLSGNVKLTDDDVIVVGPYSSLVNITGKVKRPMFYEMKKDESAGTLLQYAGGFTGDAYTKAIKVIRKSGTRYSVFNVGEFDLNSFQLCDGDSLSVDSILARYSNMVEIKGAVFRPGMYQVGGNINTVKQLIESAEGITEQAFTARGVMHRMKPDRTLEVLAVDVAGILNGTAADIPLRNEDVLYIPSKKELLAEQRLTIYGEVMYPGVYQYADNETVEDFILQAGGLKDAASVMKVDVARRIYNPYATTSSDTIAQTFSFKIKDGFVIDGNQGFVLKPYDVVYVRKSPGYSIQQNVKVEGEIMFSGTYTLSKKNQRLSEIIKQAGGLMPTAYIKGARLERSITPEERLRMESVLKMVKSQGGDNDSVNVKKLDLGNSYYVGIDLEKALKEPGGNDDIVLREGDRILIPEYTNTVKISGDVMYPNTVAFKKGKGINYYIDQAGGWGNRAKKSRTYVIYMNGTVARTGYSTKIEPGCEIIVPSKPKANKMTPAEIMTIGSGTASIATMIATIANIL